MNLEVIIFGFGSAFRGGSNANDIDLLIVHTDKSEISCRFAIQCKHLIKSNIFGAHVTVLSRNEENQHGFIRKSRAIALGPLREAALDRDIDILTNKIEELAKYFEPRSAKN